MIFFETAGQARGFLLLLYAGFLSGALYDALTPLRRFLPRWLAPVWDVFWCLSAGGLCALALALGGETRARAYALLGLCCGAGIYALGVRAACASLRRILRRRFSKPQKAPEA